MAATNLLSSRAFFQSSIILKGLFDTYVRDEKLTKRDENGFQRKKRADQKLFAQNF
jgi:hypothetical protein